MKTQEEKIDYIYETLKKKERNEKNGFFFKWGFRIFLLGYLYYFITSGLPALIDKYTPSFPSFGRSESSEEAKQYSSEQMNDLLQKVENALQHTDY